MGIEAPVVWDPLLFFAVSICSQNLYQNKLINVYQSEIELIFILITEFQEET